MLWGGTVGLEAPGAGTGAGTGTGDDRVGEALRWVSRWRCWEMSEGVAACSRARAPRVCAD